MYKLDITSLQITPQPMQTFNLKLDLSPGLPAYKQPQERRRKRDFKIHPIGLTFVLHLLYLKAANSHG